MVGALDGCAEGWPVGCPVGWPVGSVVGDPDDAEFIKSSVY